MRDQMAAQIKVKVVGVGGAGGNAVRRMAKCGLQGVSLLAVNTDVQALRQLGGVPTFAIGPRITGGMGSGGSRDVSLKAIKESKEQVADLLEGSDMVFITAGMGGGTGTGAAPVVAEMARKQGALTVGVVTLPFSFEGPVRRAVAVEGLEHLQRKVDTVIAVDNDRLLPSLKGKVSLEKAFKLADEVLQQGVQGISDILTVPGLINVDFADVKAVMANGGPSFMANGEGKGKWAAIDAAHQVLSNPLFDEPLEGATGILFNVKGGKDLTLGQVHEVAGIIRKASKSRANVNFGVAQDRRFGRRVSITLVATGLSRTSTGAEESEAADNADGLPEPGLLELVARADGNGHHKSNLVDTQLLF